MTYIFTLPIEPRGQKRDRIGVIHGHARSYKNTGQAQYEAKIRALLSQDAPPVPIEGPVRLEIAVFLPIPASWTKKKRAEWAAGRVHAVTKPDVDNAAKQIMDCMNGLIYRDDRQVVHLNVEKVYTTGIPGWNIVVTDQNADLGERNTTRWLGWD